MKVNSVRKDKAGCKVDEIWYTFSESVKNFVKDKEIYNKEVEIETDLSGKFINKLVIKEETKPETKSFNKPDSEVKLRSMALSYAKDCWVADKVEKEKVLELAESFLSYMQNGITKG